MTPAWRQNQHRVDRRVIIVILVDLAVPQLSWWQGWSRSCDAIRSLGRPRAQRERHEQKPGRRLMCLPVGPKRASSTTNTAVKYHQVDKVGIPHSALLTPYGRTPGSQSRVVVKAKITPNGADGLYLRASGALPDAAAIMYICTYILYAEQSQRWPIGNAGCGSSTASERRGEQGRGVCASRPRIRIRPSTVERCWLVMPCHAMPCEDEVRE